VTHLAQDGAARIRRAGSQDLDAMNAVVEAGVRSWNLPERVKRLVMPSYRYTAADLDHVDLRVLEFGGDLAGLAAWESLAPGELPDRGFTRLPVRDEVRDYAARFWRPVS
jgi:hypothetical protein